MMQGMYRAWYTMRQQTTGDGGSAHSIGGQVHCHSWGLFVTKKDSATKSVIANTMHKAQCKVSPSKEIAKRRFCSLFFSKIRNKKVLRPNKKGLRWSDGARSVIDDCFDKSTGRLTELSIGTACYS